MTLHGSLATRILDGIMAAATLGKIDEFECLGHFFTTKMVEKKQAMFLDVMPVTTLLHNFICSVKHGDKTYQELVTTLTKHFSLTPSETVQRFKHNTHERKTDRISVTTYLTELRSLALWGVSRGNAQGSASMWLHK